MAIRIDVDTEKKQISELTDHEITWIYSMAKYGNWPDSKIAPYFNLSASDVRKVLENWIEPWGTVEKNLRWQLRHREPAPEFPKKKPRKRRSDARYATTADRQAAYRARLKEKRRTALEQPSPANETDSPEPDVEELSATFCEDPVTETSPVNGDPEYSTCDSSSVEGHDVG